MSDLALEDKPQLVRQVRSRYQRNQYDLGRREQILYGRTSDYPYDVQDVDYFDDDMQDQPDTEKNNFFFRIRLIVTILLVTGFLNCAYHDKTIFGVAPEAVYEALAYDVSAQITETVENLASVNAQSNDSQAR